MIKLMATWTSPKEWKELDFEGNWSFGKLESYAKWSCYFRILGLEVTIAL